jgi:triphosphoribosyl-dephospho-CoA synthase
VQTACIWEATARKVGNVHRYRDFSGTSYLDFVLSASAIAPVLEAKGTVGFMIREAVARTRETVGQNTNLGIILLLAPLAAIPRVEQVRPALESLLASLTREDARRVYEAIRLAAPGGLGKAGEQDVHAEPTVTLLEAMQLAAGRDMIARQYANGYADVLDFGLPAFLAAFERSGSIEAAIIDLQLRWLARYPDSLIARKQGLAAAEEAARRARQVLSLGGIETVEGRAAGLEFDAWLRSDGNRLNPGATADLITACLFMALRENKVVPAAPFRWEVEDWL